MKSIKEIADEGLAKLRYAIDHECSATLTDLECRAVMLVFDVAIRLAETLSKDSK